MENNLKKSSNHPINAGITSLLKSLSVGIVEESVKLLGALACVFMFKSDHKIDYILIFEAVGAGFEMAIAEYAANIIFMIKTLKIARSAA